MKKFLWPIILVSGALGLTLGILGYTQVYCPDFPRQCSWVGILNNVARTIGLFFPGGDIPAYETGNTNLAYARVLAPFATMASAIKLALLILESITGRITLLRARRRHEHAIIAGCGERGQCFLHDCQAPPFKKGPVVIDRISDPAIAQDTHDAGALFIQGDARNATLLADAGLARAQQLMILGGSDEQNLEVLAAAQSIERESREPLKVIVRIDNVLLVRQLDREDDFARRPGFDVTAFNLAAATARCFFRTHPLVDQAELRGQKRVHLVCVGWTSFVFAVLEQLARLSPYREFSRPLVHLLVPDSNTVRTELSSAQPAIWDVLDIEIADLDNTSCIPTPEQIRVVEPDAEAAVTAVLVSVGNDAETAAAAMAIRERSQQNSRWHAPVYAHVAARSSFSGLLEQKTYAPDPGLAVIPIGYHEDACRMDAVFGEREDIAREIHESYLSYKGITRDSSEAKQRDENNKQWEKLKQTYRLACRRAADHLPIKILSIGAMQNGSPFIAAEGLGFAASQEELESLSELEHRSWEIDRRLDGWHPGTSRDNHARTHPALISYEDLSDEVKEFDRDMIRAIQKYLHRDVDLPPTVKREVRLGLFGHNKVTNDEKADMLRELDQTVMPGLVHTHKHDFISVCTPLAPGTDTILAEAVLGKLKDAGIDHRLVVVRTLPLENVIDDFLRNYSDGDAWRSVEDAPQSDDAPDVKSEMSAHISALSESVANAYIADMTTPGLSFNDFASDDGLRVNAYDRAASWLVEKSEIIIAYNDPRRGDGGKGGTRETLEKAQKKEAELRDHSKLRVIPIEL